MAVPVILLTISEWPLDLALSLLNKGERTDLMATLTMVQEGYMQSAEAVKYGTVEHDSLLQSDCVQ